MIAPALHALKAHRQFIVCRLEVSKTRPGKADKLPWDHRIGRAANAHDPAIWLDHGTAIQTAMTLGNEYGVGFVLTAPSKLFCLDIDDCLQPDGQWSPLARQMCELFHGAAVEVSQSGRGLHIWGAYTGDMPLHGCKDGALRMELYTEKRFIALGRAESALGDSALDCTGQLHVLIAAHFQPAAQQCDAQEWTTSPCADWRGPADDHVLLDRAMASRSANSAFSNKARFVDLFQANTDVLTEAFPAERRAYDASSADAALAQHLAFWTGRDCERILRLMHRSQLQRDKWGRPDYLRRTILNAVARATKVYQEQTLTVLDGTEQVMFQTGTQDSVALIFARKLQGMLLFNHTRGGWFEWDGTRWKAEQTGKAFNFARDLAREANRDGRVSMGSESFCSGVEKLARADRSFARVSGNFDQNNYLLNTPGGTVDLRTGVVRPHCAEDLITMRASVSPSTDGAPLFERFLVEITQGDPELAKFLQVSLGACLSGAVESHWMLFWIGTGRNGKNTLGDLVMDAMGDYARKIPTSTLMAKRGESHLTEVANLHGVRLAVSSEINDGEHWDEARINEVTGDAVLSARFMRGDLFEFTRTHKHLIYGNHRPQLRSVGDAIRSRIKLVPFKASFLGREDPDLPRRLREGLGYVLSWLIEGHREWLAAGKRLPQCRAVESESADYFESQSTPDMWVEERAVILTRDDRAGHDLPKSSELYSDYSTWKKMRGENPMSQQRFSEFLQRKFVKVRSNGYRYRGLKLKPFGGKEAPFSLSA
jgi:putative DNA primase/helicase